MKRFLLLLLVPLLGVSFAQLALSSDLVQVQTLAPGESYEGTLAVQNPSNQPATLRVYQTDYLYLADGTAEYGEPGNSARSNAPWVKLPAATATVPAEDGLVVSYRVQVPDNAALAGSYWSVIMVEQVGEAAPIPEGSQERPAIGINTVVRYAVEIVVNIGTTGERRLELAKPSLQQGRGK